ncbi:MAG: hypothetical protein NVSMB1_05750 [Polyangiales bacterium]
MEPDGLELAGEATAAGARALAVTAGIATLVELDDGGGDRSLADDVPRTEGASAVDDGDDALREAVVADSVRAGAEGVAEANGAEDAAGASLRVRHPVRAIAERTTIAECAPKVTTAASLRPRV